MNSKAAVILAGGNSTRMGTNKAFMVYRHKRMIDWVIEVAGKITANIIISTNSHISDLDFPQVKDTYENIGPMGGIFSGINKSGAKWNLVLACDIPDSNAEFLLYLSTYFNDYQAIIPVLPEGRIQPLAAWYHHSILPIIEDQIQAGDYKMQNLLNHLNTLYVECSNESWFKNVNTPSDLL